MDDDIVRRFNAVEDRIDILEDKVIDHDNRLNSIERWIPVLMQSVQESKTYIRERTDEIRNDLQELHNENKETIQEFRRIVEDGTSRAPKWVMWLLGLSIPAVIAICGWIVEAIVYRH